MKLIDIAINNCARYQNKHLRDLERKRKKYKRRLCIEIIKASNNGEWCVATDCSNADYMNIEYMQELKKYFENKGFCVKEKGTSHGIYTIWLEISWSKEKEVD